MAKAIFAENPTKKYEIERELDNGSSIEVALYDLTSINQVETTDMQGRSNIQYEIDKYKIRLINKPSLIEQNYDDLLASAKKSELKKSAVVELAEIQAWFKENDWKVNKVVIGEWPQDDIRWVEYLNERTIKRARQDLLNTILNN